MKRIALLALPFLLALSCRQTPPPHLVLITIDTLRADHMGAYGYRRPTSPRMDAFARGAVTFDQAYSYWPKTRGSFVALLTGRRDSQTGYGNTHQVLLDFNPTLASVLEAAGYRTAAVVDNANLSVENGYAKGLDAYRETWQEPALATEMDRTRAITEAGGAFLRENGGEARRPPSPHAEVTALAFADQTGNTTAPVNKQYELQFNLDKKLFRPEPDPWELNDIRKTLYNTQILGVNLHERLSRLKSMRIDLLLNLSLEELPKSMLGVARFGIWSLRCNDVHVTAGSEIGWLEILNDIPVMHCDIEIQREETTQLYAGSVIAANPSSISLNQTSFFWRASQVIPRPFPSLAHTGRTEILLTDETCHHNR